MSTLCVCVSEPVCVAVSEWASKLASELEWFSFLRPFNPSLIHPSTYLPGCVLTFHRPLCPLPPDIVQNRNKNLPRLRLFSLQFLVWFLEAEIGSNSSDDRQFYNQNQYGGCIRGEGHLITAILATSRYQRVNKYDAFRATTNSDIWGKSATEQYDIGLPLIVISMCVRACIRACVNEYFLIRT